MAALGVCYSRRRAGCTPPVGLGSPRMLCHNELATAAAHAALPFPQLLTSMPRKSTDMSAGIRGHESLQE